jgi:hypothetical protein
MRVYGHPSKARIPALVKVPWFVAQSVTKREVSTSKEHEEGEAMTKEDDLVNQRLAALGYL